jgi:hypothetical protein
MSQDLFSLQKKEKNTLTGSDRLKEREREGLTETNKQGLSRDLTLQANHANWLLVHLPKQTTQVVGIEASSQADAAVVVLLRRLWCTPPRSPRELSVFHLNCCL